MNRHSHIKRTLIAIYKIVYEDSNKAKKNIKVKRRGNYDRIKTRTF